MISILAETKLKRKRQHSKPMLHFTVSCESACCVIQLWNSFAHRVQKGRSKHEKTTFFSPPFLLGFTTANWQQAELRKSEGKGKACSVTLVGTREAQWDCWESNWIVSLSFVVKKMQSLGASMLIKNT